MKSDAFYLDRPAIVVKKDGPNVGRSFMRHWANFADTLPLLVENTDHQAFADSPMAKGVGRNSYGRFHSSDTLDRGELTFLGYAT